MKSIHLKNILSLLKKTIQSISIYCRTPEVLVIYLEIPELTYTFEINSHNRLIPNATYLIDMVDMIKIFKHIKSSSVLLFYEALDSRRICIDIKLNDITQMVQLPYTYNRDPIVIPYINSNVLIYSNLLLSDFCRMIKTLKNTSDYYSIEFDRNNAIIKNVEAVIPISYTLFVMESGEYQQKKISNNTLLRLNKLACDNIQIKLGVDFLLCELEDELKFKITFL